MKTAAISTFAAAALLLATPALAQESSRADFERFCNAIQGRCVGDVTWIADWPGLGKKKGDKVKCYIENAVIEDGNEILSRFFGGSGSGTSMYFYNAASKEITQNVVNSGGSMWTTVYYKEGGRWVGIEEGSNPDGDKIKGRILLTISDDGNKHSYSGSTTIGGDPADELQDVWIRVSDK